MGKWDTIDSSSDTVYDEEDSEKHPGPLKDPKLDTEYKGEEKLSKQDAASVSQAGSMLYRVWHIEDPDQASLSSSGRLGRVSISTTWIFLNLTVSFPGDMFT